MKTHPASIEEKLGFDVLRARLQDYVHGALGRDRLDKMRPARSLEETRMRLERVTELRTAFSYDEPVPLSHYLDVREALRRAAPEGAHIDPEDLHALRLVLVTLRRTKRYFESRSEDYPRLAALVEGIAPLKELEEHVRRILDEEGRLRDDASQELLRIRERIRQKQNALRETLMRELRKAQRQGYATEEQPTLRGGRQVIPVRAEAKRKVEGFVHDTSSTGQTVYIEPAACLDLNNEVRELQSQERREVERILREATAHVRRHLDALRGNVHVLARFDLLQAKARLTDRLDAHMPELGDEGRIEIREGRNPVLQLHFDALQRKDEEERDVVPLDLELGGDYRTLVITGPNAGGKTVAMKTVGLFALMLAYGLPLPVAPHSHFSFFEELIVDIGDEQSIEEDLSTFSSHVSNLRYMLKAAGPRSLVLIDEAGTGTDPAEGGALAQAILERLTEKGARTIATTHHGTLKVYAHETEHVENGSMEFDQETLRPTYRFQAGVPGSSYAFEIAERIGLSRSILERARALAGEQKSALEDLIATFEARNQELQRRLDEARRASKEAEKERDRYEGKVRRLEKERDEIRQQALEEAERIVQGANALIERTIREIKEAQAEKEATREAREAFEEYREDVERRRERAEEEEAPFPPSEKAPEAPSPDEPVPSGPIEEGDRVVVDSGSTAAEVMEIEDGEAVVTLGSMRMRVALDRLTKVGKRREPEPSVRYTQVEGEETGLSSLSAQSRIDLRGYRVEEALQEVEQFLDEAVAAGLRSVEILHGKGTGALRSAIHEYLADRSEVARSEEAPLEQGGAGVTHVELG